MQVSCPQCYFSLCAGYRSVFLLQLFSPAVLFKHLRGVSLHHWPLCSGMFDEQELILHRQDTRQAHLIRPIRVNEQMIQ